jgi:hypothetical protein
LSERKIKHIVTKSRLSAGRNAPKEGLKERMADRLLVAYKTPIQRVIEAFLVLAGTYFLALLCQRMFPGLSSSYVVVAGLAIFYGGVHWLGGRLAERRGAPMMTRDERNRRYLGELGPVGSHGPIWHYAPARSHISQRRQAARKSARHH